MHQLISSAGAASVWPIVLSMPDRRRLVAQLSEMGMTTRAIAPIVGVGQMTIADDQGSTVKNFTVDLTGRNGKTYKRSPRQDKTATTAPDEGDEALVTPDTIGRNGEAYVQNSRAWSRWWTMGCMDYESRTVRTPACPRCGGDLLVPQVRNTFPEPDVPPSEWRQAGAVKCYRGCLLTVDDLPQR